MFCSTVSFELTVRQKKLFESFQLLLRRYAVGKSAVDFLQKKIGTDAPYGRVGCRKLSKHLVTRAAIINHLLDAS